MPKGKKEKNKASTGGPSVRPILKIAKSKGKGRKVAMAGESVSTAVRRATGRGIILSTWLQESKE